MHNLLAASPVMPYIILILGFVLLIKGADLFVDGCVGVAKLFSIPSVIIGLTIVAFGTSAPEAAVSITSALKGANAMAVSNVLGSNIFNLLIVIGVCSVIKPVKVTRDIIKRDYPISIIITILLLFLSTDFFTHGMNAGSLGLPSGLILLVLFFAYIIILINNTLRSRKNSDENEIEDEEEKPLSVPKCIIYILLGICGIAFGGDFVVDSATNIATTFHISETLIGLTIVALGTSLPELVTSIVAAHKGENDLALGNVVGSNIFNILMVLGMSATVCPINLAGISNPIFTIYDTLILLGVTVVVYVFVLIKNNINRLEGSIMVLMYSSYLAYIILR